MRAPRNFTDCFKSRVPRVLSVLCRRQVHSFILRIETQRSTMSILCNYFARRFVLKKSGGHKILLTVTRFGPAPLRDSLPSACSIFSTIEIRAAAALINYIFSPESDSCDQVSQCSELARSYSQHHRRWLI